MNCRGIAEHARLITEADLRFPIILSSDGRIMDGMHRVLKALNLGKTHVRAVRFASDPAPDFVGVDPDELPYDKESSYGPCTLIKDPGSQRDAHGDGKPGRHR